MKIFVYHTPELTPDNALPDLAIAIDVLRATTTIASALTKGIEAIQTFSDIEQLKQSSEQWPPEKRLRAGERGGKKIEGFDSGNSPLEYTPNNSAGRRLFISTTNGTRCLEKIQAASTVVTAALVNRQAVVNHVLADKPQTIWMVGSGWEGSFALEDTVCAGAICQGILENTEHSLSEIAGNDEVIAAIALYQQWKNQLLELLNLSSHGQRLTRIGTIQDIEFCAQLDTLDIVPIQTQPGVLGESTPAIT